jgi:hypothetical protein
VLLGSGSHLLRSDRHMLFPSPKLLHGSADLQSRALGLRRSV